MTPEERAEMFIAANLSIIGFESWDIDQPLADCIRSAQNDALDNAAAKVVEMLPGNPFGQLAADLILLQKQ